jgi:DNA invertase Pin-like site-specific DNA recombinase
LTSLFAEFAWLGVNFISIKDGIDLSTTAGRLIANVLASVAQYETEVRGERVAAGLAAKKERVSQGLETWNAGRPKGTPDKCTPELKNAVIREVQSGKGKAAVARAFKLSRQTVYTILNEAEVSSK